MAGGISHASNPANLAEYENLSHHSFTSPIPTPTGRSATIVVATSDATTAEKAQADHVLNGSTDGTLLNSYMQANTSVYISSGTIVLNTDLNIPAGCKVFTSGYGTHFTGNYEVLLLGDHSELHGGRYDGIVQIGILGDYCQWSNLWIENATNDNMIFQGNYCTGDGLFIDRTVTGGTFADIEFDNATKGHNLSNIFLFEPIGGATGSQGGLFFSVHDGYDGASDINITNVYCENVINPFDPNYTGTPTAKHRRITISNIICVNCEGGIYPRYCEGVTINSPKMYNTAGTAIKVYSDAIDTTINDPYIDTTTGVNQEGIVDAGGATTIINNGHVLNASRYGYVGATGTTFNNCYSKDAGTNNFYTDYPTIFNNIISEYSSGTKVGVIINSGTVVNGARSIGPHQSLITSGGARTGVILKDITPGSGITLAAVAVPANSSNWKITGGDWTYGKVYYWGAYTDISIRGVNGYIAPGEIRTVSRSLTAGNANAICFAWHNPEVQDILIKKVVIEVTTGGGTAGSHLDVGIADDATGTNRGTEFFNDLLLNSVQINDSWVVGDGGTQTKWVLCQDSASATDGWIVGQILDANAASLVGKYYIEYVGR